MTTPMGIGSERRGDGAERPFGRPSVGRRAAAPTAPTAPTAPAARAAD